MEKTGADFGKPPCCLRPWLSIYRTDASITDNCIVDRIQLFPGWSVCHLLFGALFSRANLFAMGTVIWFNRKLDLKTQGFNKSHFSEIVKIQILVFNNVQILLYSCIFFLISRSWTHLSNLCSFYIDISIDVIGSIFPYPMNITFHHLKRYWSINPRHW